MEAPQEEVSPPSSQEEMTYKEWLEWRRVYFKINKNFHYFDMNPEEKLKKDCKNLLHDMIIRASEEDEAHKAAAIKAGKGSQAVGESWM